jgi:hypothetical protein
MQLAQLIATICLGMLATIIAFNQLKTSREKIRLDLYHKRFEVYEALMKFIDDAINIDPEDPKLPEFRKSTELYFLMPDKMDFLNKARQLTIELWVVNFKCKKKQDQLDHGAASKLRDALIDHAARSKRIFRKYLFFPENKILAWY